MESKLFFINAFSNLHVGSGEINYGLVDNLIQRDSVTGLPTIHSSSLKGALREHFTKVNKDSVDVRTIFGSDPKDTKDRCPGKVRFFDADLVSLPVRATGSTFSFVHVSTEEQLNQLWHRCEQLGIKNAQFFNGIANLPKVQKGGKNVRVEDIDGAVYAVSTGKSSDIVGEKLAIVSDAQMVQLCNDDHLPVITRNCLDDGQSTNLFYEQVLPRYSRLITIIMGEGDIFNDFCNKLDKQVVQIGAHATIGYGFCQFKLYSANK